MILKNNDLQVTLHHKGAEIQSIIHKEIEYLWQGDAKYWGRRSPVLFPIVGRLLDNEYKYENNIYSLSQHGFARDMEFSVIDSTTDSVLYLLTENKSSLEKYPFDFSLFIGYKLIDNQIEVTWKVINASKNEMYFQIGAHPAFNFLNGSLLTLQCKTNQYHLEGTPYVHKVTSNVDVNSITFDDSTFKNDAIIYDNINRIVLKDDQKSVELRCEGFPYLGIWTTVKEGKNAPFICLEPWFGIADYIDHNKELVHKKGINVLKPQEVFKTKYYLKFD